MYDHRKLGRELGLFDSDPLIGAGLPYWLPAGAAIRQALERYIADVERRAGYQQVYSPVLGKRELYEISGHWSKYSEDMYPPMSIGGEEVVLRPSLCPHHALMFRSRAHSYRELPLRMSELGGQYRSELSGALGGLTRVRAMQLNDGHIFCMLEQVADEALAALELIKQAHRDLGISASGYVLSLPSEDAHFGDPSSKYVGDAESWALAADLLRDVLEKAGLEYSEEPGEAAFYGPKIDIQIEDSAGRVSTLSTIQLDFHQPAAFGLEYIGADGNKHRPVMVHRAIVGSIERAVAHLIEVHGGAFPAWLAPVQLVVLPISDAEEKPALEVARRAADRGLRVEVAHADEGTLGARIRENRLAPYQAVIGAREVGAGALALRLRDGKQLPPAPIGDALDQLAADCNPLRHE
ncbi:threonine--tRNA ligase [Streptomyces sp. SID13031]|uniref:threonine--tRNA ligase n=1 Tax=Streptomyces sp. SID13031 TaxID=2706046 RepID=UPI0013C96CDA|nr:threonine--tRNA ligase [Streptomyces sp. SID13031]NEA32692.1 threonine--tRNA ligase [Streptomyces sp. SID13031]